MAYQNEADMPPNLTCLKSVDALLRCPICFDFFSISVMTKCSHNFCSLCIRKFLSFKSQCPVCNLSTTEQDLRINRILDNLVIGFQAARQELSRVNVDSPQLSPLKRPARDGSILSHFFRKVPKKTSPAVAAQQGGPAHCASRRKIQADDPHLSDAPPVVVKKEKEETELMPVSCPSPVQDEKPVIKVECPACALVISQRFINKHLDICVTRGEKKESLRSSVGSRRRPMGKLVYNLLSMRELKKKLRECHLSALGSRDHLVRRHREFVHIYNAQCDSLSPKTAEEIAKEVEANEKITNQLQGKAKPVFIFSKNQSNQEIDEMHSNYRKQHSTEFSHLVDQVRGRLKTTRHTQIKQEVIMEGEEAKGSHSAGSRASDDAEEGLSMVLVEPKTEEQESAAMDIQPASPSLSDVSISSSLSDIFQGYEDVPDSEKFSIVKRAYPFRDEDSPSLILGKRCPNT